MYWNQITELFGQCLLTRSSLYSVFDVIFYESTHIRVHIDDLEFPKNADDLFFQEIPSDQTVLDDIQARLNIVCSCENSFVRIFVKSFRFRLQSIGAFLGFCGNFLRRRKARQTVASVSFDSGAGGTYSGSGAACVASSISFTRAKSFNQLGSCCSGRV